MNESAHKGHRYTDFPFQQCMKTAGDLLKCGWVEIHQKFTCNKCNSRQTMDKPNTFYTHGKCEECSHITDIYQRGCNYLLVTGNYPRTQLTIVVSDPYQNTDFPLNK